MIDNVATDLPVCIGTREGVRGDHQICLCVVQTVPHSCNVHGDVPCLVSELAVSFDFGGQCDIVLLLYSPVYGGCVELLTMKEEVLLAVIGSVRSLLGSSVERMRVDWAVPSVHHKELRVGSHEVDMDKRGNVKLSGWVRNELEESISRVFKVVEPLWPW